MQMTEMIKEGEVIHPEEACLSVVERSSGEDEGRASNLLTGMNCIRCYEREVFTVITVFTHVFLPFHFF
jgi:hypothetical protein